MTRFNHLKVPDQYNQYFTKYPQGYTILEALLNWVQQVDDMIDQLNLNSDQVANLQSYVDNSLDEMLSAGKLNALLEDVRRLYIENEGETSTEYAFEIANFGNTAGTLDRRAFVIHHYNDGEMAVLDNVGDANVFFLMRNANNPVRRPDKPSTFYGTADFFRLQNMYDNAGTLQAVTVLEVKNNGDLVWGHQGAPVNKGVELRNEQASNNGKFAFTLKNKFFNKDVLDIQSEDGKTVLWVQNPLGTRADIVTSNAQTQGLNIVASLGNMDLTANAGAGMIRFTGDMYSKTDAGGWAQVARFVPKPATSTSAGERGDYFCDTAYLYVCIGTNLWERIAVDQTAW